MRSALDRHDRIKELRLRFTIVFIDLLIFSYLWVIGNCFFSEILYREEAYNLAPFLWMIPFVVLGVGLWESFGTTAGMRLARRQLMTPSGQAPGIAGRWLHWLGWHAFPFGLITAFTDHVGRSPQEIVSGLTYQEARQITEHKPWYRTSLGLILLIVGIFTFGAAVGITQASLIALFTGAAKTGKFWRELVTPDTSLLGLGLRLLVETFFMAMIATLCAVVVSFPLSFLAARNLSHGIVGRAIYTAIRVLISAMRSVDAIIWAIIFALWVGMGTFAGALALFVHSVADLVKLYSEQLESIDQGPIEAVSSTGGNRLQVIRYGIVPQILNPYLSFTLYRWDINVRMATIIGVVGGGGIGWRLYSYLNAWQFKQAGMLMILIMILVWTIDYVSSKLRARVEAGASKEMALQVRTIQGPATDKGP